MKPSATPSRPTKLSPRRVSSSVIVPGLMVTVCVVVLRYMGVFPLLPRVNWTSASLKQASQRVLGLFEGEPNERFPYHDNMPKAWIATMGLIVLAAALIAF